MTFCAALICGPITIHRRLSFVSFRRRLILLVDFGVAQYISADKPALSRPDNIDVSDPSSQFMNQYWAGIGDQPPLNSSMSIAVELDIKALSMLIFGILH